MTHQPLFHMTKDPTHHGYSFDQQLITLDEALLAADDSVRQILRDVRNSVVRVRQELDEIHMSALPTSTAPTAACFDCGRKNLDVFYTSKHGCYHLCETCFHTRHKHGRARSSEVLTETAFE